MRALKKMLAKGDAAAPAPPIFRAALPTDAAHRALTEKVERNQAKYRAELFRRMRVAGLEPPAFEAAIGLPKESWHASHVAMALRAVQNIENGAAFELAWP